MNHEEFMNTHKIDKTHTISSTTPRTTEQEEIEKAKKEFYKSGGKPSLTFDDVAPQREICGMRRKILSELVNRVRMCFRAGGKVAHIYLKNGDYRAIGQKTMSDPGKYITTVKTIEEAQKLDLASV
tara:strand:+ start:8777 stop:9154 length:378 start_codon:yes stop_codon:yes gene_type:complete